jgi:hypothetical protein
MKSQIVGNKPFGEMAPVFSGSDRVPEPTGNGICLWNLVFQGAARKKGRPVGEPAAVGMG